MKLYKWAAGPFLFLPFFVLAEPNCFDFAGEMLFLPKIGTQSICWNSRVLISPPDKPPYQLHCIADPGLILDDGSGAYVITTRDCSGNQTVPSHPDQPPSPDDPEPIIPDKTSMTKALAGLYYETRDMNQNIKGKLVGTIERTAIEMSNYALSNAMQIKNSLELSIRPELSNLNSAFNQYKTTATEYFAQSLLNQETQRTDFQGVQSTLSEIYQNTNFENMQLGNIDSKLESLIDIGTFIMNKPSGGGTGGGTGGGAFTSADVTAIKNDLSKISFFQPNMSSYAQNSANSLQNMEYDVRNIKSGIDSMLGLHRSTLYDMQSDLKKIADSVDGGGDSGNDGGGTNPNPIDYKESIKSVENAITGLSSSVQGIKDQLGIDSGKLDGIKGSLDAGVSKLSSIQSDIKSLSDFVTDTKAPDGKSAADGVALPDYEKFASDSISKIQSEVEKHADDSGFSKLADKSNFNNMFSSASSISQIFSIAQSSCTSIDFGSNAKLNLCQYAPTISNVLEFIIWALTILFCFTYTTSLLTRERLT